ncbi:MAG TPA: hypothetical protein PLU52_06100 [Opitutaceae bacterium]|nr:hypothetical protein [Opitutaceae bacterium]
MIEGLPGQQSLLPEVTPPDPAMVGRPKNARRDHDLYETPAWVTEAVLPWLYGRKVWEPACGRGAMAKVISAAGIDVAVSDLHDHGYGRDGVNFLTYREEDAPDRMIVTNPPYSLADAFVRKAILLAGIHKQRVAMLLRHEWSCASSRVDLFDWPFAAKVVLTDRPVWFPGTKERPRHSYAWYVWDWARPSSSRPEIFHHKRVK